MKSIQEQIQIWKWRGLSLYDKVTIVKTLLIPKFICVASVLCTPNEFVRKLNEMIYRFLWNGPDKVARAATINSINFGGLNTTDFETSIKSLRLAWIGRYLNENSAPWKSFFQYQLKNYVGTIFLKCNYNIKDYEINLQFNRELLMWWADFREKHVPELNGKNILWNNELIRIADRPIYYPKYVSAGVIYCQDLFFNMNMSDSLQQVMKKGLKNVNFCSGWDCAVL